MAKLLLGKEVNASINEEIKAKVEKLNAEGITPTLGIIRIGEREDDIAYERGATKRCETLGVAYEKFLLPADVKEEEVLQTIEEVNKNDKIPMVPKMKITLGAKYSLTDRLSLLANYTYISEKEVRELDDKDNIKKFTIDSYGTIDLSTMYQIDEYSNLKLGVKNLTSTKYNLRETSIEAFPAPERNYFIELSVKF